LHWFVERHVEAWQARQISSGVSLATSGRWHLSRGIRAGNHILRRILLIVLLLIYYPYTFNAFPRTRQIVTAIGGVIGGPLRAMERATERYIPNLGYIFVLVVVGWIIAKIMKYLFSSIAKGNIVFRSFPPEWAEPTYSLCRALLIVFIVMAAFPYLPGSKSQFFRGFSLFIGAMVTFSSGGAISNVLAGIVLTYTRAFREGDVVRIENVFGTVTEKTLLSSRITTIGCEQVTIPNGKVLSSAIINYSTHPGREAVSVSVGATIGYDVDWRTIHKLMLEGARRTPQIREDPAPRVLEASFGNYSVEYELRAWAASAEGIFETYAALRRNILDAFNEAGVEIMTPTILAHRDANDLAVPEERFPVRHGSRGIAVTINPVSEYGREPISDPLNVAPPSRSGRT
jgi:small-conductance mechanosensitive channel